MAKSMKYTSRTGGDYIGGKLSKDKGYRTEKRLPGSVQSFKCERGLHPTQKCQSACKRDPLSARKRDPLSRWRKVDRTRAFALRAA